MSSQKQFLDAVGKKVASVRKSKGFTQEQLSERSGVETVSIGFIEQGSRRPTLTTLYKLAKGLGVNVRDLIPN